MSFREILLPEKLDLDVMLMSLFAGVDAGRDGVSFLAGSAPAAKLADPDVLCVEVGGAGQTANNNFDHHSSAGEASGGQTKLSAAAQFFERVATLFRYVDDVDRGEFARVNRIGFPSLLQLVSGMQLVVKEPERRLKYGHEILRAVLQSGINPYEESMEKILDTVPGARTWAEVKRQHEAQFAQVAKQATWYTTAAGRKLAVIQTAWIGAPGALYGYGADIVIALNPQMELGDGRTISKFTIATQGKLQLSPVLSLLEALEIGRSGSGGWGGPNHGTVIGLPRDRSSDLSLQEVADVVKRNL